MSFDLIAFIILNNLLKRQIPKFLPVATLDLNRFYYVMKCYGDLWLINIRLLFCPILKPPQRLTIGKMNNFVSFLMIMEKFITFEQKQVDFFFKENWKHNSFPERSPTSVQNGNQIELVHFAVRRKIWEIIEHWLRWNFYLLARANLIQSNQVFGFAGANGRHFLFNS